MYIFNTSKSCKKGKGKRIVKILYGRLFHPSHKSKFCWKTSLEIGTDICCLAVRRFMFKIISNTVSLPFLV